MDVRLTSEQQQLRDAAALRRRKGIGDSTFAVIQEALAGNVPGYLADLRERAGVEKASELRKLLRGDLHSHSDWSDGLTPIDLMVDAKGGGTGTIAPAAKIKLNQDAFVVEDYSGEVVRLTSVKKTK